MTYTLITGASSGIGRAMAFECASRGMNLCLVALDDLALYETAQEIRRQYSVEVHCIGIDLTVESAPVEVYLWCRENDFDVDVLINNAGFGNSGLFEHNPLQEYYQMLELNNHALIGLTYQFLPDLKNHTSAHILNVSSMEATMPLPYKAVYTGTKNFIYAFSLALREEARNTGVAVSVLCPGPVLTNPEGLQRLRSQGKSGKILMMMPEEVAKIAIRSMLKKRRVIIPGVLPYFIFKLLKVMPTSLKMRLLERIFRVYRNLPITQSSGLKKSEIPHN